MKEARDGDVFDIAGRRYVLGPDVDLEKEAIYDDAGRRLTDDYVATIVKNARTRGRPSLSGPGARSPQVSFRVSIDLRDRAEARAAKEHKSLSELAREALEHYLSGG